ncbi:42921_t:CDS:1, partial [Gigaspora margarita]
FREGFQESLFSILEDIKLVILVELFEFDTEELLFTILENVELVGLAELLEFDMG